MHLLSIHQSRLFYVKKALACERFIFTVILITFLINTSVAQRRIFQETRVSTMAVDAPAPQGAGSSAVMILTVTNTGRPMYSIIGFIFPEPISK